MIYCISIICQEVKIKKIVVKPTGRPVLLFSSLLSIRRASVVEFNKKKEIYTLKKEEETDHHHFTC